MHVESAVAVTLARLPCALLRLRGTAVLDLSDEACRELGRGRDELIGDGFLRSLVEADRSALATSVGALVDGGQGADAAVVTGLEVRRPLDGVTVEVFELCLAPEDDGSVLVDVRDATERHRLRRVLDCLCTSSRIIDAHSNTVWPAPVDRPGPRAEPKAGIGDDLGWIHTGDVPDLLDGYADLLAHPGETRVRFLQVRRAGPDSPWVETRVTAVNRLDDPRIAGIVVRSEHQTDLQPISQADGSFRSLAETVPIGIIVIEGDGRTNYVNAAGQLLLGLDGEGGFGDWIASARAGDQEVLARLLTHALDRDTEGSAVVAFEVGDDRGRTVWVRVDVVSQLDEHRRPIGAVVSLQDVTAEIVDREQLLVAREKLLHLATHDSLTGLPNRAFFMDRLQRALSRMARTSATLAVLFCDLDGFKSVNDTLGHGAGDQVLVEAARRLSEVVRATDTVSRFGGDEFVVVCEGFADREGIAEVAARLVDAISRPMPVGGSTVSVGISIGIRLVRPDTAVALAEVLQAADAALYEAKAAGKGRFHFA
jgi:diguanylate cyclase (GGDEF)-like protein/PAS domain S-box-containing protein